MWGCAVIRLFLNWDNLGSKREFDGTLGVNF
jgi:hypothetical protein